MKKPRIEKTRKFNEDINTLHNEIMQLPTSEVKYHLYLLLIAIHNNNTAYTRKILKYALRFTQDYKDMHEARQTNTELGIVLTNVKNSFNKLITHARTNTLEVIIIQTLLNLAGALIALIIGVFSAILGGIGGFARGIWNDPKSLLQYSLLGLVTGFLLGAAIGFRIPKKLCKEPVFRQIKFALNGLGTFFQAAVEEVDPGLQPYRDQAYDRLLCEYFDNKKAALEFFLKKPARFEIRTFHAEFLSPTLAGYLGQHFYIWAKINKQTLGIEFTPSPSNFDTPPVQSERREVSTGRVILEILTLHLALQPTHTLNKKYIATQLKSGDRDCKSYVDKLLIGTSQPPTILPRFGKLKPVGTFVGDVIGFLGPNPEILEWKASDALLLR